MICKKCSRIIVCHAFSHTNCDKCSTKIVTGHIPGYKVCSECSEKHNICQQCGDTISDDNIITIQKDLTKEQKMILIEKFHEMYYNTDQDTQDFASEFYNVVDLISMGHVPVQLEFLEDFKEEILDLIKEITVGA